MSGEIVSLKLKTEKFAQPSADEATAPVAAGRPRQCSDEQRRSQLIEKAEEIFLEKGYHPVTMDEIARRAGMSKKTIYTVFQSKAALFDALLTARLAPFADPIPDDGRPIARVLTEFLTGVARVVLSPRHIALTRLLIAESPCSPDIGLALRRQAVCNGEGALEGWLARQAARGTLNVNDVREAGSMLFGMAIGEPMLNHLTKGDPPSEQAIAQRIGLSVRAFLSVFAPTRPAAATARRALRTRRRAR
ncbi:MAG TPA: TetR/AcrR family transcriptional regulator [Steroidobacteraceae bacterium]|nr:TetR/AcrR family transcriptional regulator [Steroidobacteraceae bacterium]